MYFKRMNFMIYELNLKKAERGREGERKGRREKNEYA